MTDASRKQLGLIGLGQFGRFAVGHLRPHFEVLVADRDDPAARARELGVQAAALAEAASAPIVVLAVPVQALEVTLRQIAPHLRSGALVADVCSVKAAPLEWMCRILPDHVEIVGTHPLFGPQSAASGLSGHKIVVCPERTERLGAITTFLEQLGLEVLITDGDTHDRECAYTQAVAQYIGQALSGIEGTGSWIGTPAATLLRDAMRMVQDDSQELFEAIQTLNPYAEPMRQQLRARFDAIDARLQEIPKDPEP